MTTLKSHLTSRVWIAEAPDTHEQVLFVEIAVDCPSCGTFELNIPGHHLRALRDLCLGVIDLHPDLVGEEAGLEVIKRLQFTTPPPPRNPEDN